MSDELLADDVSDSSKARYVGGRVGNDRVGASVDDFEGTCTTGSGGLENPLRTRDMA